MSSMIILQGQRTLVLCRLADIRDARKELDKQELEYLDVLVDVNVQIDNLKQAQNDTL
jgi:hypothetical protein